VGKVEQYIELVASSLEKALLREHHMDVGIFGVDGFSTPEFRCFLNNLCALENANYLEVGVYKGGTSCAALCGNQTLNPYLVDNYAYGPEIGKEFERNIQKFSTVPYNFYNGDSFDESLIAKIDKKMDIYFYDGDHSIEAQEKALTKYFDKMADTFIWIVDDYNWADVKIGTQQALNSLPCTVEKDWTILTPGNHSPLWHNGVYIAVITKKQ
jgi:hypothetical protein